MTNMPLDDVVICRAQTLGNIVQPPRNSSWAATVLDRGVIGNALVSPPASRSCHGVERLALSLSPHSDRSRGTTGCAQSRPVSVKFLTDLVARRVNGSPTMKPSAFFGARRRSARSAFVADVGC